MTGVTCSASPATEGMRPVVRALLVRGMLAGLVAGLLVFGFGRVFGEPQVDRAIAFESAMGAARTRTSLHQGMAMAADEPELVSRAMQASIGLFTGVVVYAAAFGGLFALVFACAYGRLGALGPRAVSALLAAGGFVALYLVPSLTYPANPPAVGDPETIGLRTALYFLAVLISVAAMVAAVVGGKRLARSYGVWAASLAACAGYLAVVVAASLFVLPAVDEVPEMFPAPVLWHFRMASLGMQATMWATIGLLFGWLTERAAARHRPYGLGRTLQGSLR